MKKITLCLLAASFLSASLAQARFCEDPATVNQRIADCGDNGHFAEAAAVCLERFEAAIQKSTAGVEKTASALSAQSKANQANKQINAILDYQLSKAALDTLIAQGKAAQEETAAYFDGVVWPEDSDEPEITGTGSAFDDFLNSESCYKDNRDAIGKVLQIFDNEISQLMAAKEQSEGLRGSSSSNEGKMNSLGTDAVKDTGPAITRPPLPSGKSMRPESDISGTKEEKKK